MLQKQVTTIYTTNMQQKFNKAISFYYENICNGLVAGIDEVGRGPIAGDVYACAVILIKSNIDSYALKHIKDSKQISSKNRELLAKYIMEHHIYAIGKSTVKEIDRINILQASLLAMRRAIDSLPIQVDLAIIDGNKLPELKDKNTYTQNLIKGDQKCLSIAAASIIAKYHRDSYMIQLAEQYPNYSWHKNMGYGTKEHIAAISEYGITPHHRRSFAPVRNFLNKSHNLDPAHL